MRSVNTAYKVGREIGREVGDVWIADEALRRHVRRTIEPRIKLLRSDEEKTRDGWAGLLALVVPATLVAVTCTVLLVGSFEIPETLRFLLVIRAWAESLPYVAVILVTALLLFIVLLLIFAVTGANRRANEVHHAAVTSLYAAAFQGATAVLENRRRSVGMPIEPSAYRAFPPPSPRPNGVDARGAEELVAQWMRHIGEVDAELTSYTGDGGIDVQGARSFAQVKHYAKSVGVAPIRELAGVAANDPRGRTPLFFTSTGYARGALDFADSAGIALFVYNAERAGLEAMNAKAKTLMHNGIS